MNVEQKPILSVIVTSYTTEHIADIYELLDSMKNQTYENIEVIFVAERSRDLFDKIKSYASEKNIPNMRVLFNDGEYGLSAARNLAIAQAQGDVLGFLDDDVLPYPDWAEAMMKTFDNASIIGVTGPALPLWEDESMSWFPKELYWIISCTDWTGWNEQREVRSAWGMNMSFKKEAFSSAGLFLNEFGYHKPMAEDLEFSLRVKSKTGKRIFFNPHAKVRHKVHRFRLSLRFIAARSHHIGVSRRLLKRLYPNDSSMFVLERSLLRRIMTRLLNIVGENPRNPVIALRKLSVTATALFFVTLGYYSHVLPFTQDNKCLNKEKRRLLDRSLNKLDNLAMKARPWIPFTALNSIWHMMDKEAKTILDVGCGKGEPMMFINKRRQFYTVGVDIFEPYLRECKRQGTHNEYVLCDVRKLPFKKKSFDIVLSMEVLEHLEREEGERLLEAMERLARRQVILSTPVGKYKQEAYDGNPSQEHKHAWKPDQLKKKGYEVKVLGLRNLGGDEGVIARLPRVFKPLGSLLWVMAGPLVYFFPGLVGEVVCRKRLTHCDLAATSPGMMQACGKESRS